jgi:anti-sigma B factor antagonist
MIISSRTPEGQPNRCLVCGSDLRIEPSAATGDAPRSRCGHLLWFTWEDRGDVNVIKPTGTRLDGDSVYELVDHVRLQPGVRLAIDFSDVEYVSSVFLAKLINLKRKVAMAMGHLRLEHLHPDLLEVFRITRLDQVFDLGAH